jgi:hypothetical protein
LVAQQVSLSSNHLAAGAERGERMLLDLVHIFDEIGARTGVGAAALADPIEQLSVASAFQAAIDERSDRETLQFALNRLFTAAYSRRRVEEMWPSIVQRLSGGPGTPSRLREKASWVAAFILCNADMPWRAVRGDEAMPVGEGAEGELKLEAAIAWYRVIEEVTERLAFAERDTFCGHLQDELGVSLALHGCSADTILERWTERGEEYALATEWVPTPPNETTGLLWIAASYGIAALGGTPTNEAIVSHIDLFLQTLKAAELTKLLQVSPSPAS